VSGNWLFNDDRPFSHKCNLQEFRPGFAEASLILGKASTPIFIAKVDGDTERELAQQYSLSTFPTTLWFENGELQAEFPNENPTAAGVVSWVERVLNGSAVELTSVEQFAQMQQDLLSAAVVGYLKNGRHGVEYTAFRKREYLKKVSIIFAKRSSFC
jgi:hypothetical protein